MSRGSSAVIPAAHQERETRVNIRGLDATGPRSLLLIDGVHFRRRLMAFAPSTLDHSRARAGPRGHPRRRRVGRLRSDAIAGVINVVLKRGFTARSPRSISRCR